MIDVRTISSLCLLMTFLVMLGPALKCYKCDSEDSEDEPICDYLYWKQLDKAMWDNITTKCNANTSAFCFVEWKTEATGKKSIRRGCTGNKNVNGTRLLAGCIDDPSKKRKICLCTGDLCNDSPTIFSTSLNIIATIVATLSSFVTS